MSDSPTGSHFETGSLTLRAPQQSEFIGSSSGVHFIKLVRAVCADTSVASHSTPSKSDDIRTEDVLGGNDDESDTTDRYSSLPSQTAQPVRVTASLSHDFRDIPDMNSQLPSQLEAQNMAIQYFESWHPLLPFLYGPIFMQDLNDLYRGTSREHRPAQVPSRTVCHAFLLRCLFATVNPDQSSISPSDTLAVVGQLASQNDLLTIQAVLMAQLRCVSAMALRAASSHSGLLSRLLLHAGLHRCPFRYEQLDSGLKDLRKRIFWSAYILDRYLSQALGLPPTIADSDIDVCAPGCPELHSSALPVTPSGTTEVPRSGCSSDSPCLDKQEFLLAHLVTHAQLVSRVLEVFHKSIHVRTVETDKVLSIRADANKWFNSLPHWPPRPGRPVLDHLDREVKREQTKFIPFLHVLYQQLLIAIHRPYLSLPRTSAEYGNSIQLVIRAARQTILLLSEVAELFWPGYLASAWMSGLVLIYACQTQAYGLDQGIREIDKCLHTLAQMQDKWKGAGRCHTALSKLVGNLSKTRTQSRSTSPHTSSKRPHGSDDAASSALPRKRLRPNQDESMNTSEMPAVLSHNSAHQAWPGDDLPTVSDPLPGLDIGNGDMFQDISWDGDFSSIDHFTLHDFSQDWLR